MRNTPRSSRRKSGRHAPRRGGSVAGRRRLTCERLEERALLAADMQVWQNTANPMDVNDDAHVSPIDALLIINELNRSGPGPLASASGPLAGEGESHNYFDVNGDNTISPIDVLMVINDLNGESHFTMQFVLKTTDLAGNLISNVNVGEEFVLQVFVEDIRDDPKGLFVAHLDVDYDASKTLVSPSGLIEHGADFNLTEKGDLTTDGEINETGSIATNILGELGAGEFLLFSVPFLAEVVGEVTFTGNQADLNVNETIFAAASAIIPFNEIDYGSTSITVLDSSVNNAPVAVFDSYEVDEDTPLVIDAAAGVLDNDTDVELDDLTAAVVDLPSNGTVTLSADGSFTYTPNLDFYGVDTFTYMANDGAVDSNEATVTIAVNSVNDKPVAVDDSYEVNQNGELTVDVATGLLNNDTDVDGDSMRTIEVAGPSNGVLNSKNDGSFVYTPNPGFFGVDSFIYRANDFVINSEEPATVTITVNEVLDLVRIRLETTDLTGSPISSVPEGGDFLLRAMVEDLRGTATGVFAAYLDVSFDSSLVTVDGSLDHGQFPDSPQGDALTPGLLNEIGGANFGIDLGAGEFLLFEVPFSADDAGTTAFTGNPADDFPNGFTLLSNDDDPVPTNQIDYGTTSIVIVPMGENNLPVAVADTYDVDEEGTLIVDEANGVLDNDSDADEDPMTAVLADGPSHGTLNLALDGSFTYTPETDFFGTDSFTYRANDGMADSTQAATVTINVSNVNDAPLANGKSYNLTEGNTLDVDAAAGVLSNDSDADDDPLTAVLKDDVTNGNLTLNLDGSFTYTPDVGFFGTDSFSYWANDGSVNSPDDATVTIFVSEVNDPPVVVDDDYNVDEDTTLDVNVEGGVLANDNDPDGLSLTATLVANTTNGTLSLASDGSFTYTPASNFFGTDSFTYVANDGSFDSPVAALVTIDVSAVNDPPVAVADNLTAFKESADQVLDVLANDSDPDGDTALVIVDADSTGSEGGTIDFATSGGQHIRYTPATGFLGEETFSYVVRDSGGLEDETTVTVTVVDFIPSSLSGFVYADVNNDGFKSPVERSLGGVLVTLEGTDTFGNSIDLMQFTAGDGSYEFDDLAPGSYTLSQFQPEFMIDGLDTIGSQGGDDSTNDQFSIEVVSGTDGTNNNFGERGLKAEFISIWDYLSSSSNERIDVAVDAEGRQLWYSFGDGWNDFVSADLSLSKDRTILSLTVADGTARLFTTQVSRSGHQRFCYRGSTEDGAVLRVAGESSDFELQAVQNDGEGEALSQAGSGTTDTALAQFDQLAEGIAAADDTESHQQAVDAAFEEEWSLTA